MRGRWRGAEKRAEKWSKMMSKLPYEKMSPMNVESMFWYLQINAIAAQTSTQMDGVKGRYAVGVWGAVR